MSESEPTFDVNKQVVGLNKLRTKPNAEPLLNAPCKCSVHLRDKLKAKLEKMEKQAVIRKIMEHTDWCSRLAYSIKKGGSLIICIDPQKLNKLMSHKVSTTEEINPHFTGSSVFSKLNAKAQYWSVPLDRCRTPFGRYC